MLALLIGVLSALAILIVMMRINLRRFMGFPATLDALVVLLLIFMLHGSYVGMVAAVVGGIAFSAMITLIRRLYGYEELTRKGWVRHDGILVKRLQSSRIAELNGKVKEYWHAAKECS